MATDSRRPKGLDGTVSALDAAIEGLNLAENSAVAPSVKAAFGSASLTLAMIKDSMINEKGYVELGLDCADICRALDRGMKGKRSDDLNQSVREAINQLTTTVTEIKSKVTKQSKRNSVSRFIHSDKKEIAAWRLELNRILHVFNTELAINTHTAISDTFNVASDTHNIVSDIHRAMQGNQGGNGSSELSTQTSQNGELPPPPPRTCFGRTDLIEEVIGLAEKFKPVALLGPGGIGKTSVALTVLHSDRIKERFGNRRRWIRCDQLPPSLPQFLSKLSKAIGAGIENPENLTCLHPSLSSGAMMIFLDNAESIIDPQGPDARGIYTVVEELSRFDNICLGITSRISTIPPRFKRPIISTLSINSACDIFYDVYDNDGRSDVVTDLVKQLDFHALSITLLATTASHNMWGYDRLAEEWNAQRTQVLQTDYGESLSVAIELSLSSPSFRKLGPYARDLLGVVAFFPQGIDEKNLEWLFPTIPDRKTMFDKFCVLSLTSRNSGPVTMLAPIRDHLCPRDPTSSPLLCATRDHYFTRLSVDVTPGNPSFEAARWIMSEDVNVEHLLNVFTSIDNSDFVWEVCANFMNHLYWHKCRYTVLGPKIEGLPDSRRFKPKCLIHLSGLHHSIGNPLERKRLLTLALKLERERGDDFRVAEILENLSSANKKLRLYKEGIEQTKEALVIYERLGSVVGQADCLCSLAELLDVEGPLGEAEEAALRALDLLPKKGEEFRVCQFHRILGRIYKSKREGKKAIHHFEEALRIASTFGWGEEQFWINFALAQLFVAEGKLDDANTHIERGKPFTVDDPYRLGRAMKLQARIWYLQNRLEGATSEAQGALEIFENFGASEDIKQCKTLLQTIKRAEVEEGIP